MNQKRYIPHVLVLLATALSLPVFAYLEDGTRENSLAPSGCGKITFNCDTHRVSMNGVSSPLNCGASTPRSHTGRIGSKRRAVGTYWRSMAGAPVIDIGLGAILVHTLPPKNGRTPAGYNSKAIHTGCLNVSPAWMGTLSRCQGSSYEIIYASRGGSSGTQYAKRYNRAHYAFSAAATY